MYKNMDISKHDEIILSEFEKSVTPVANYFTIGYFCNDTICLEQFFSSEDTKKYEVYDAEKGKKYNSIVYDTVIDAIFELMYRLSVTYRGEIQFYKNLLKRINSYEIKEKEEK